MTTKTRHVVVDGSNIATEGRSLPSLAQLNDAVLAFLAEFPDTTVTVVVDATFGHRIDKSEVKEFDTAVANNELVAPPAGAVGRGDAFVLGIAHKAGATILSNDSFQEFHGDYPWLFDDGRLIGGKPVPNVGWVFVERVPVRGPVSRKAVRDSKGDSKRESKRESKGDVGKGRGTSKRGGTRSSKASKEASQPMPVPSSPPPGATSKRSRAAADPAPEPTGASGGPPSSRDMVNDVMPFLEFVEHHPVGTSVNAVVDSYSSHGAYVRIGDVLGYVPLRLMSDPPPRSAREVMKVGDAVTLVVAAFAPARRSIDCAMPHMATGLQPQDTATVIEQTPANGDGADADAPDHPPATRAATKKAAAKKSPAKKAAATKAAATKKAATKKVSAAKKATAKKSPAKKAATKKAAAKKSPAKKAPATKESAANKSAAKEAPATKKAAAKKAAVKKSPAKKKAAAKKAAPRTRRASRPAPPEGAAPG